MSSYLVTGGAGFIGSHIVDALVAEGHSVRVLDNLTTGKISNIEHNLDRIELIKDSLTSFEAVKRSVDGVDYVIHQGALPSVPRSVSDPISSNSANIDGTLNLLVASRDAGVKRLVYASSSSVYGDTPVLPKREDMPPNPLSPYAMTKLGAEYYCRIFTKLYGFETVSLRYFNVFGPRQDPSSQYAAVIPKFLVAIKQGERPVIYGNGQQSRDFTYVKNNVNANLLACTAPLAAGEVFNIACGDRFSLLDLVNEINSLLGTNVEPVFEEARAGDVMHSQADISKARDLLGFEPEIAFREGLRELVRWYQSGA